MIKKIIKWIKDNLDKDYIESEMKIK